LYNAPAAPASYDTWMASLPVPPSPGHRAPTAIPPGGTLPNLLAYALAVDPFNTSAAALPQPSTADSRLRLTYTRHRADLDYTVEASSDLVVWTPVATNSGALGAETTVTDLVALTDSPRRFLRLRVSEK
ncbi:MAG: phosphohydrolase, partial [Rariglobus sp.]|nr:phosphohydrolase [Rariglobus sp.]